MTADHVIHVRESRDAPTNPGVKGYGCEACKVNTFKDKVGNSDCSPCEAGKTTNGLEGSAFCVDP